MLPYIHFFLELEPLLVGARHPQAPLDSPDSETLLALAAGKDGLLPAGFPRKFPCFFGNAKSGHYDLPGSFQERDLWIQPLTFLAQM